MSEPAAQMPVLCQFDPEARAEYLDAIRYYTAEAGDAEVAVRFVAEIESALAAICGAPERWRVVDLPDVRRYVLRHFPFVLYYRHQPGENLVIIDAVMHTSRQPDYWRGRRTPPA